MYRRILVPFDGSATAWAGLEAALRLASSGGCSVRLLYVLDVLAHASGFESSAAYVNDVLPALRAEGRKILDSALQRARTDGVAVDACLHERAPEDVAAAVLDEARSWAADVIALGTHGRHGLERWELGSVAEQVLRRARIPVLIVRESAARVG